MTTICYSISINWVDQSGMSFTHSTGTWATPENAEVEVAATVKEYFALKVSQGWQPVGEPIVEYEISRGRIISGTAR